jgi:hypothetical protein
MAMAVRHVGGNIDRVNDVSIKAFPCPKVNDKGLQGAWWWADKIAIAVALWATYETWKAAKEEYKIGKRYYDLAREQWDFFLENYKPLEDQELAEIWAELPYEPDYPKAIAGHTNAIDKVFNAAERHRSALSDKYCICPDVSQFTKTDIMKSTVRGDSDNFARRYAEKLAQEKNDIRWARRIAAASRGRNLLSDSASLASKAAGLFGDYAKVMGNVAAGAMAFSGYVNNRMQTEYNPVRSRINARADVPNTYRGFDAQAYWGNGDRMMETTPRGGIPWGQAEANAPYDGSSGVAGYDPTGYASTSTR